MRIVKLLLLLLVMMMTRWLWQWPSSSAIELTTAALTPVELLVRMCWWWWCPSCSIVIRVLVPWRTPSSSPRRDQVL